MRFVFGACELDTERYELRRAGQAVALEYLAFRVLAYLLRHAGRAVAKQDLLQEFWPGPAEDRYKEYSLRNCLHKIRQAVGDVETPRAIIETVRGYGYRCVAAVTTLPTDPTAANTAPQLPTDNYAPPGPSELPRPLPGRRQLTVLSCALVAEPAWAQLDPEDFQTIIQAFYIAGEQVIQRFEGYIAQYNSEEILIYFGYPTADEAAAPQAVRAGLALLDALGHLRVRVAVDKYTRLAVRLGIHTGLMVVDAVGTGGRHDPVALGETPTVAARLQHMAAPDTVVVSDATWRLVQGYFMGHVLDPLALTGIDTPGQAYQVLGTSGAQSRMDVVSPRGLTPLVGREAELALLRARWAQARDGLGQVVVLSGEAGIGKSRLIRGLYENLMTEPHIRVEWRCSPYTQQSPLYPIITHLHRLLRWHPDDTPAEKLRTLEETLTAYGFALPETMPLFAALLSLPLPERYPPLAMTPQRQRQQTMETLLAWLLAETTRQPVLFIVEDLHWIDPSTLEFLTLLINRGPIAHLFTLLTCRPEFAVPWGFRAHCTPLTLPRLPQPQVAQMIGEVAGGKVLPPEVVAQVVAKTDGVPLFVEELTKMILESGLLREQETRYDLTGPLPSLAIPATLHDSLMARLDRLSMVKAVAQLGATIGRTFAYALLQAVASLDDATLQQGLRQLVEAELVYQQGVPPQATYTFKHALIQDAAYQSLLRSTRQQSHQRIAQVLETQFPETVTIQPELLAHHYTEAGLQEQAIGYWQQAGHLALQRSANPEAVQHLTQGLALLTTLPETPARAHQELDLQLALGVALQATHGLAAPEVEQPYARARTLCMQVGNTLHLVPVLRGLSRFYSNRGVLSTERELGEQLLRLAQRAAEPTHRLAAYDILGHALYHLGDYSAAQTCFDQGIALIDPATQWGQGLHAHAAPEVTCLAFASCTLWCLGFPVQAIRRNQEALALTQELDHPHSLVIAQYYVAFLHQRCREAPVVQAHAEALLTLATAQGFPFFVGLGTFFQGWALARQGQHEVGLAQMHQGMGDVWATGARLSQPLCLTLLAEVTGETGRVNEGLRLLDKALEAYAASERGDLLTEAYRLQGQLLLRQTVPDVTQAEACFRQALTLARCQQARAWELRAAISLSRLWQRQGKQTAARELLAPIYDWFTEGFDTAELQEARALLEDLGA